MRYIVKKIEAHFVIDEARIKTVISLFDDGVISLKQSDEEVFVYPAEAKAIVELVKNA